MHILIVSQHDSRSVRGAALTAGAGGYVAKSNAVQDLIPDVRRIQSLHARLAKRRSRCSQRVGRVEPIPTISARGIPQ